MSSQPAPTDSLPAARASMAERPPLTFEELRKAIASADPDAVLVGKHIIRRVLQAHYNVSSLAVNAPHEHSLVVDRHVLYREVEQDELELGSDRLLPDTVVLLAKPHDPLPNEPKEVVLRRYWRFLFEAHVHLALNQRVAAGAITESEVRGRIESIGHAEFEEIRTVLEQENRLVEPDSEVAVYVEFIAYYLEIKFFFNNLRSTYFPAIQDFSLIDKLVAKDLDANTLFLRFRPEGAPDPVIRTDLNADESRDYFERLLARAKGLHDERDLVRAAVLLTKASRVAPAHETADTVEKARDCLDELMQALAPILSLSITDREEWMSVLPDLLDKADQGSYPDEAKLLLHLQDIWLENGSKRVRLDVIEWLRSWRSEPQKLEGVQHVRDTNHLRQAVACLTQARIDNNKRQAFARLLQKSVAFKERKFREQFRPRVISCLDDAGWKPTNVPEQVAQDKIAEELLDRISEQGFFTFSELRDTLSRNQLKCKDLSDPDVFWRGDQLLQLDRLLRPKLEGVYRRSEFYLRWLESLCSLLFGTGLGRLVTLNFLLPFCLAFLILGAIEVCYVNYVLHGHGQSFLGRLVPIWVYPLAGLAVLSMMRYRQLPQFFIDMASGAAHACRLALYDWPLAVWNHPLALRFRESWMVYILVWCLVGPLLMCWLFNRLVPGLYGDYTRVIESTRMLEVEEGVTVPVPERHDQVWLPGKYVYAACFLASLLFLNSRFGRAFGQAMIEIIGFIYAKLRFDFVTGLFRAISVIFAQIRNAFEILLYKVDESFRLRDSSSWLGNACRMMGSLVWLPISMLLRLYFLLLVEPTINPIKLPFSSLAWKLMVAMPGYIELNNPEIHRRWLEQYMHEYLAFLLCWPCALTCWFLPGAFVFFFWEMKENWKLFAANRASTLQAEGVGSHGETVLHLLHPGFHSGTIPREFSKLRKAERDAYRTDNWRTARTHRLHLVEVERQIRVFIERELLALLGQYPPWGKQPTSVHAIHLSCKRIRIELAHDAHPGAFVEVHLEDRAGWLMASLHQPGWLKYLSAEQKRAFAVGLLGWFKAAGVDFIHEALVRQLPSEMHDFELGHRALTVWLNGGDGRRITYDLMSKRERLIPKPRGREKLALLSLEAASVFYRRSPIEWNAWAAWWSADGREGNLEMPVAPIWIEALTRESRPQESTLTDSQDDERRDGSINRELRLVSGE